MPSELDISALVTARGEARAAERAGDLFAAYDRAVRALESWPEDLELRYLSVLALARSGATELAKRRFKACGFETEKELPFPFDIDVPALGARLTKDSALLSTGPDRTAWLTDAALAYRSVLERCQRTRPESAFYPAINAAALSLWAGSTDGAALRLDDKTWSATHCRLVDRKAASCLLELLLKLECAFFGYTLQRIQVYRAIVTDKFGHFIEGWVELPERPYMSSYLKELKISPRK